MNPKKQKKINLTVTVGYLVDGKLIPADYERVYKVKTKKVRGLMSVVLYWMASADGLPYRTTLNINQFRYLIIKEVKSNA